MGGALARAAFTRTPLRLLWGLLVAAAIRSQLWSALRMHVDVALQETEPDATGASFRWCRRQSHNASEPVDLLPGGVAGNRLYLQGARLTTSHDPAVHDLHVDLFGFAGDFLRPATVPGTIFCMPKETAGRRRRFNETLLAFDDLWENATLYCQLDCPGGGSGGGDSGAAFPRVRMTMVPTRSGDGNQRGMTAIWRCNVTDQLDRDGLRRELQSVQERASAAPAHLRVRFFWEYRHEPLAPLLAVDLPLATGVVGHAGPQIQAPTAAPPYLPERPVPAALCAFTYGAEVLDYVEEFVQHHLNVGFGSITIGVRGTTADSGPLQKARRVLRRYLEAGVVTLAYRGLPEDWNCDVAVEQMQLYQTCLYHHKGIAPYSAYWDIDEFWIPPAVLRTDGRHGLARHQLGVGSFEASDDGSEDPATMITASNWSSFRRLVREDPLWQQGPYARSVSIGDTMAAIDRYHAEHGCANEWCFHMFPSIVVHQKAGNINRRKQIGLDFDRLEPNETNVWHKSIVNTKYAHVAGIHVAGSCLFEPVNADMPLEQQMRLYHPYAAWEECSPNRFGTDVYGGMHHYMDLLSNRLVEDGILSDSTWRVDPYVESYASTVGRQLNRNGWNIAKAD